MIPGARHLSFVRRRQKNILGVFVALAIVVSLARFWALPGEAQGTPVVTAIDPTIPPTEPAVEPTTDATIPPTEPAVEPTIDPAQLTTEPSAPATKTIAPVATTPAVQAASVAQLTVNYSAISPQYFPSGTSGNFIRLTATANEVFDVYWTQDGCANSLGSLPSAYEVTLSEFGISGNTYVSDTSGQPTATFFAQAKSRTDGAWSNCVQVNYGITPTPYPSPVLEINGSTASPQNYPFNTVVTATLDGANLPPAPTVRLYGNDSARGCPQDNPSLASVTTVTPTGGIYSLPVTVNGNFKLQMKITSLTPVITETWTNCIEVTFSLDTPTSTSTPGAPSLTLNGSTANAITVPPAQDVTVEWSNFKYVVVYGGAGCGNPDFGSIFETSPSTISASQIAFWGQYGGMSVQGFSTLRSRGDSANTSVTTCRSITLGSDATATSTNTSTPSPTRTSTPSPTRTPTPSPTNTSTPSPTRTVTPSRTATNTSTPRSTNTPGPSSTPTVTPSPTITPSPTATSTSQVLTINGSTAGSITVAPGQDAVVAWSNIPQVYRFVGAHCGTPAMGTRILANPFTIPSSELATTAISIQGFDASGTPLSTCRTITLRTGATATSTPAATVTSAPVRSATAAPVAALPGTGTGQVGPGMARTLTLLGLSALVTLATASIIINRRSRRR